MGRKSGNKKNRGQQSGYTGKGARIDRGPVVHRAPADKVVNFPAPGGRSVPIKMDKRFLDRKLLHPALRNLPGDAEIRVIMIPEGSDPPEGRAGDYLGTLSRPYPMPDGDIVPAGARVYRDLNPELDPDSARPSVPRNLLASGTDAVPWARNQPMSEVPFRVMQPGPGEKPLTVNLRPEDIAKRGLWLEAVSSGNDELPDWFEPAEPEPPVIRHMRAGDVLDQQARLAEIMTRPPADLLDFFDSFVTDTLDRAGKAGGDWAKVNRWAGMFWPAQTAQEWCGVLARQLKNARAYQVTPAMVDTLTEVYESVIGQPAYLNQGSLPWPAGFAYFDKPMALRDQWGNLIYNRAYSWDVVYLPYEHGRVPGVRIISWSHGEDRDSYWTGAAPGLIERFGGLGMGNSVVYPFGQRINIDCEPGEPRADSAPLLLVCLWVLLESVVATTRTAPHAEISHAVRKRAARTLKHGDVHVVTLRRAISLPAEGEGGHRNVRWTCRWFVESFWRHVRRDPDFEDETDENGRVRRHHAVPDAARERCIVCGMKISYVATYDKGPAGLPYKTERQLYRLAR